MATPKTDKLMDTFRASGSDKLRLWQLKFLESIEQAVGGGGGGGALMLNSTGISILNAISASDQDIEFLLVTDTAVGNGDPVLKQVTNYQTGVPVITYENVDGTTYVPAPNPVPVYQYLNPSSVMQLMLAQLTIIATPDTLVTTSLDVITGTGAASVAAGKRTISFMNTGDVDVEVDGETLKAGLSITYPELSSRDTYDTIPYNALTGELTITTVG